MLLGRLAKLKVGLAVGLRSACALGPSGTRYFEYLQEFAKKFASTASLNGISHLAQTDHKSLLRLFFGGGHLNMHEQQNAARRSARAIKLLCIRCVAAANRPEF